METNITLSTVAYEDKSVLRNLMELCQHDYSEFNGEEVDMHGLFGYRYLDHYWSEEGRYPFFMVVAGKLAGFALVRRLSEQGSREHLYSLAEFFVLRKYRRRGVGRNAAAQLFKRFPGRWKVGQEAGNLAAQAFWRSVISDYTGGEFQEIDNAEGGDVVQTFSVSA